MSTDIVKFAFIAGEISPTLYGRTDLTKFDLGLAEATNFFVDYRGGLSSRPGFRFTEFVLDDQNAIRMCPFEFSPEDEDTYVVMFGNEYVRFLQGGEYVLEDDLTITGISNAAVATVTSAAHGLAAGRWVKISGVAGMTELNGRTYEVRNPTANTFELYSVPDGVGVNSMAFTAYTSGGVAKPVYEIASSYTSADLEGLHFDQYRDQLRITSFDFPITNLVRNDHADWELVEEDISTYAVGPTITSSSTSAAGAAQTIFAVSKIFEDGSESTIGPAYKISGVVNYPVTEGSVSINWAAAADAEYYNVYRSVISVSEVLNFGAEMGYVGKTTGTKFTDPNIIPDFGRTPPNNYNPFAPGAVLSIDITNPGSGYPTSTTVAITDPDGTGFVGQVIVDDTGAITKVVVKNGGTGYTAPVVSFTGAPGVDGAATAEVRALTDTYPSLSATFQQRQVYAASRLNPITVWGGQYKRFSNFNYSRVALDKDSYEHDLDTQGVAPIRHILSTRGGLLCMTQKEIWLLSGGAEGEALTPNKAIADPQTYNGVSLLKPLRINSDILYAEGKGFGIKLLGYNELSKVYGGEDKSILSAHLFGEDKELIRWGFQESPYKTVWSVREDGAMLAFTIVQAEEVFAWTPCETRGRFVDLVVVQEDTKDIVYVCTERYINGRWTKFIERQDLRQFVNVEDAWCVDCGLSLDSTSPGGTVTIFRDGDTYTAEASTSVFTGSEGKILRAGNGIFSVTTVTSATEAVLSLRKSPTNWVPQTDTAYTFPTSSWTLDTEVTTLSGLWHLEGETVSILGDGNVFPQQVVEDGSITLPQAVSRCIVGLPFECRAKTLPLIVPDAGIEAKRKRIVAVSARVTRTRGLQVGDSYDTTYEWPERAAEAWGQPIELQEGIEQMPIGSTWDEDAFTYFKLTDPLPATLLSLVQDTEVGDDPD